VSGFATDGSIRAICGRLAFAFDAAGRLMPGWPVERPEGYGARIVGDDLMLLSEETLVEEWDGRDPNQPLERYWLTLISADGTVTTGEPALETAADCWGVGWTIGPDGVAYGVSETSIPPGACLREDFERAATSVGPARLWRLDMAGPEPGWPISIDGAASYPEFAPDGRVLVTVGTYNRRITRIHAIDPRTRRIVATSPKLPILSAHFGYDLDCGGSGPAAPMVSADGTVFLDWYSETWAFGPDLRPLPGSPYEPSREMVYPVPPVPVGGGGLDCTGPVGPSVGPNGTLYLSLRPASEARGGRLDAIAKNGKRPAGWPVRLNRAGAEFWYIAVGEDGSLYALAVEPEGRRKASATLLAIDTDSEVRYAVTLLEP
jgi:hypothetical protein